MSTSTKADRLTNRPPTAEVLQFQHFNRSGDIIPHGWNKHIGRWFTVKSKKTGEPRKSWRAHPFAERLLARTIYFYTPTPLKHPTTGEVIGHARKFDGPYWQMNQGEMAKAFGCSRRTIIDELQLLRDLGLVRTEEANKPAGSDPSWHGPIQVIPIYEAIVRITGIEGVEGVKKLHTPPMNELHTPPVKELHTQGVNLLHNSSIPFSSIPGTSNTDNAGALSAPAVAGVVDGQPLENQPPVKGKRGKATKAKQPPKPKEPPDPRADHPAIALYRKLVGKYPNKLNWDELIEALGDTPDEAKATDCLRQWTKVSSNVYNLTPWLDWYRNGCPPAYVPPVQRTTTNGTGRAPAAEASLANLDAAVQRIRAARSNTNGTH